MKNVCFINGWASGSTGSIIEMLSNEFREEGINCSFVLRERGNFPDAFCPDSPKISRLKRYWNRLFDLESFGNKNSTYKILSFLERVHPDIISLHNVHPSYLNLPDLVNYCKQKRIPIAWTLHDEWLLTGRCCSFDALGCNRWQTGCGHCRFKSNYPRTVFVDNSSSHWIEKRKLISGNPNIFFMCPSSWIMSLFQSPQSGYCNDCYLTPNPIDTDIFRPSAPLPNIVKAAAGRVVIGGAAFEWNQSKGFESICELSRRLDPRKYLVVIAGNLVDSHNLPSGMLALPLISDKKRLASFYSSLDLFVNFTQQDNSPNVNIESLACGTPVLTYKTGGAAEMVTEKCGFCIEKGNFEQALKRILDFSGKDKMTFDCVTSSLPRNKSVCAKKYLSIFSDRGLFRD